MFSISPDYKYSLPNPQGEWTVTPVSNIPSCDGVEFRNGNVVCFVPSSVTEEQLEKLKIFVSNLQVDLKGKHPLDEALDAVKKNFPNP